MCKYAKEKPNVSKKKLSNLIDIDSHLQEEWYEDRIRDWFKAKLN